MAAKKAGRPALKRDKDLAEKVKELAAYGAPQEKIAIFLGIAPKTLRAHYRQELDLGQIEANAAVARKLFDKCMAGDVSSLIFWAKTRLRWNEKQPDNSEITRELLEKYIAGQLTLKQTALEFAKEGIELPEAVRILLAKEQPEPEDPTEGAYCAISDEEMEARVAERLDAIQTQIDALPKRQKQMRELREQVRDKFGAKAVNEKDKDPGITGA